MGEEEEGDFLDKQRAVMRGSPLPLLSLPPRLAVVVACSQIVHYNHQEEVFPPSLLPSLLRSQPAYNNDSGGGNNGLCDVTTDGRRMLSSLSSSRTHLSLSRFQV